MVILICSFAARSSLSAHPIAAAAPRSERGKNYPPKRFRFHLSPIAGHVQDVIGFVACLDIVWFLLRYLYVRSWTKTLANDRKTTFDNICRDFRKPFAPRKTLAQPNPAEKIRERVPRRNLWQSERRSAGKAKCRMRDSIGRCRRLDGNRLALAEQQSLQTYIKLLISRQISSFAFMAGEKEKQRKTN